MALGTTGTVIVAALVAGAAGAGTAVLVMDSSRPPAVTAPAPDDRIAALEERLARQGKEINALAARWEEAANARPHAGSAGSLPSGTGLPGESAPPGSPAEAEGAITEGMADLTPAERTRFESLYRQMREREQEDARKARLVSFEANTRMRLDRIPEKLALTPEQKDAVMKILMDRAEKLRLAFEEARAAGGTDAYRAAQEKTAAIREEARRALQETLTQDQVRAVEEVVDRGAQGRAAGIGTRGAGEGGGRRVPRGGGGSDDAGTTPPR
jgi:hypothetical protein